MAVAFWAPELSLIRVLETEQWRRVGAAESVEPPLEVIILHTSDSSTRRALRTASALGVELSARVRILAPVVVPFARELDNPQVPVSFTAQLLRELVEEAQVDAYIDIVLCRDLISTFLKAIRPQSLIVLGQSRTAWWKPVSLGRENRLAQRLRARGHQVVPADLY